jgi:hypothetical protein
VARLHHYTDSSRSVNTSRSQIWKINFQILEAVESVIACPWNRSLLATPPADALALVHAGAPAAGAGAVAGGACTAGDGR